MKLNPYPKYKDSGVEWLGEVPEHWEIKCLKWVCDTFPSNVDKKSYEDGQHVGLCNYTDVYYNESITSALNFMAATATTEQIVKFSLKSGDTIITKDSETADDIAIAAFVPEDIPGVVCGYHLSIVRPKVKACGAFIKNIFDSHYAKNKFAVLANGLTRVGLGQYALNNVEFPFPPLEEQQTIAAFLDAETARIDALIAEYEILIDLLKEKRQALISHAVTKGLNPDAPMKDSGVEWLGEVPEHWSVKAIKWESTVQRGASPRPIENSIYFDDEGEYAWVRISDVTASNVYLWETEQQLSHIGDKLSVKLQPGTLFLSIAGSVGKPCITEIKCCIHDGFVWFPAWRKSTKFLYYVFASGQPYKGLGKMGTQLNLNTDTIGSICIGMPSLEEQRTIAAFLDTETARIDALVQEAENSIALLRKRRTTLISDAVTGKIDVRELQ